MSGNPGGRPKRTEEEVNLIAACKEKTPEALGVIGELMARSKNDRVRLAPAEYILDRGWGRPTTRQEHEPVRIEISREFADANPTETYMLMLQAGTRIVD